MNNFERILAEGSLYDPSVRDQSDLQCIQKAWTEVAAGAGKDEAECRKVWKSLRDKFVRIKKRVHARRSDPSPYTIITELGWLTQFVKHRGTAPNVKDFRKVFSVEELVKTNSFPISLASGTSETVTSGSPLPLSLRPSSPLPLAPSTPLRPCPSPKRSPSPCSISVFPAPSISPCSDASPSSTDIVPQRKSATEYASLRRLEQLDWEKERAMQQDSEDLRFAAVIADMLAKINPQLKSEVKFKIYQILYEAGQKKHT
ncbi:uncharacterized protein LOC113095750 [Carassius auratus]|uniref:Uncharacterized protein LOC113095750 n=1 Tax=Carassius auratus TaxID=7957 RepID=A0A6P6P8F4_CARAU|nr:uncharacterized protein LOC113095750 [Carassius auratus]